MKKRRQLGRRVVQRKRTQTKRAQTKKRARSRQKSGDGVLVQRLGVLRELASLGRRGMRSTVLFLVHTNADLHAH